MGMCRACLTTGNNMVPMDAAFVNSFNLLTNLNIKLTEEMPLYLCATCMDAITFCMTFREKCIASDLTMKDILFPNKSQTCENNDSSIIQIKEEVELELHSNTTLENDYEEPFDNYDNITKTREDEDLTPNKKIYCLRRNIKKEPKEKKKKIARVLKNINCFDDTVEHCGICSKSFDNSDNLVKHFEHHKLDKSCGLCLEQFIDFTHLLAHRIEHLPENEKKCYVCLQKFVSVMHLEYHYIKKHNFRGEDGQLLCKLCLAPYQTSRKLMKHIWAVHSEIKFECHECGKGFRAKNALRSHLRCHKEEKKYECDLCDFSSKYSGGIKVHKLRKHTAGRVYCKACGQAYASQEKLDKHPCKHTSGIICPICGCYVKRTSLLNRHLKLHSDTYRYHCDRCPAKFKSMTGISVHKNKHDGNKPFLCAHCSMSFYSHSVLIKHRRTHTGEKPYVCKICDKGFTGNNNLKVHMKVHGQYLIVKKTKDPAVFKFE